MPLSEFEPDQNEQHALRQLAPIIGDHEVEKAVLAADPAQDRQHDQRKRHPGDHIGDRLDQNDAEAAGGLPLGKADPHRQQHQVERVAPHSGEKRPPEAVERAIEAGKAAAVAFGQTQAADERRAQLPLPCRRRHQGPQRPVRAARRTGRERCDKSRSRRRGRRDRPARPPCAWSGQRGRTRRPGNRCG